MSLQFIRAKPVQACKLGAVVAVLLFSIGVTFGFVPGTGITSLFLVPMLGLGLAIVVTAEALLVGYRYIRTDGPLFDRLANRPLYTVVRAGEIILAVLSVGTFVFIVGTLPEGPMAGPGAIGLFFVLVGLSLLILVGSLVRTLVEYYDHHTNVA